MSPFPSTLLRALHTSHPHARCFFSPSLPFFLSPLLSIPCVQCFSRRHPLPFSLLPPFLSLTGSLCSDVIAAPSSSPFPPPFLLPFQSLLPSLRPAVFPLASFPLLFLLPPLSLWSSMQRYHRCPPLPLFPPSFFHPLVQSGASALPPLKLNLNFIKSNFSFKSTTTKSGLLPQKPTMKKQRSGLHTFDAPTKQSGLATHIYVASPDDIFIPTSSGQQHS